MKYALVTGGSRGIGAAICKALAKEGYPILINYVSREDAALAVKNAGLVESDTEFNKYLCSEGYDKRLRVGSFEIPKDADFETIAKSLCGIK